MDTRKVNGDFQRRVLEAIDAFYGEKGYMPTVVQLGATLGKSSGYTSQAVRALWRAGDLKRIRVSEKRYIYVLPRQLRS